VESLAVGDGVRRRRRETVAIEDLANPVVGEVGEDRLPERGIVEIPPLAGMVSSVTAFSPRAR